MKTFYTVWSGQFLSTIGSDLTAFALGVWVYQKTGSATLYSLLLFLVIIPSVVISPLMGAIIDRMDRRKAMIIGDVGAGCSTLALAFLVSLDALQIWHLYLITSINAVFTGFQWPAYMASTSLLVPKEKLGKASGMVQLAKGVAQLVSPVLGGVLLGLIDLSGIILIDFFTFFIGITTLLSVRFPSMPKSEEGLRSRSTLWKESLFGFRYLRMRIGLLLLLFFLAGLNFFVGIVQALATPVILLCYGNNPALLGTLLSTGGIGMLVGSIIMGTWGGPKRLIHGVFGFGLITGVGIFACGFRPESPALLGFFIFLLLLGIPMVGGCNQAIWQKKVHFDVQGKVFGVRQAIATSSLPLAYLLAGPLADKIFTPLANADNPAIRGIISVIGGDPGAGIGMLYCALGLIILLFIPLAYQIKPLAQVENDLPDADLDILINEAEEIHGSVPQVAEER